MVPDGAQAAYWESIKFAPDGSFALLAGRSKTGGPNYVMKLDPATGALSGYKGSALVGAGATDLMFVPEGVLPLGLAALVTAGQNGTGSFLWYAYSGEFLSSGQPGGFGNIGRVARHVFVPDSGEVKNFVSGYSNALAPNLWARSSA